jgi:hypothetical protein
LSSFIDQQTLQVTVSRIVKELSRPGIDEAVSPRVCLADGRAGECLLLAEASRVGLGIDVDWDREVAALIESVGRVPMRAGLMSGFTGPLWFLAYLKRNPPRVGAYDALDLDQADAAVHHAVQHCAADNIDLIGGLVGYGIYCLESLSTTCINETIPIIVRQLAASAQRSPNGVFWRRRSETLGAHFHLEYPHGWSDLGFAHGAAGIVAFLTRLQELGLSTFSSNSLLREATWQLRDHVIATGGAADIPSYIGLNADRSFWRPGWKRELAWCYGALGVAVALASAARALGDASVDSAARALAFAAQGRFDAEPAHLADTGLCHGLAGNSILFRRLALLLADETYWTISQRCVAAILTFRGSGAPCGPDVEMRSKHFSDDRWCVQRGLLYGNAGIGLALLGSASQSPQPWESILLVS